MQWLQSMRQIEPPRDQVPAGLRLLLRVLVPVAQLPGQTVPNRRGADGHRGQLLRPTQACWCCSSRLPGSARSGSHTDLARMDAPWICAQRAPARESLEVRAIFTGETCSIQADDPCGVLVAHMEHRPCRAEDVNACREFASHPPEVCDTQYRTSCPVLISRFVRLGAPMADKLIAHSFVLPRRASRL